AIGLMHWRLGMWTPAIQLAVTAGIVPMIFAVSIRVIPVFARRNWKSALGLQAQIGTTVAGGWLLFAGGIERHVDVQRLGHALLAAGGLLFILNLISLFGQLPMPNQSAPPTPYPEHRAIDRVARRFTMLAGGFLVVGLASGLATSIWPQRTGRWELVWAHALLVGFFLSMTSGVCYHVLARWTGAHWRWPQAIRLHLIATVICLPVMLIALATDHAVLFSIAGPLQALALLLFLANILPMIWRMPHPSREALVLAIAALASGLTLGAMFAGHPEVGARYRMVHAELNLFGWTGLLISGMAYYLVPRLFGHPLRWPRLAVVQVGLLAAGVTGTALASVWRIERGGAEIVHAIGHGVVSFSFVLLGVLIGVTMLSARTGRTVARIQLSTSFTRPPMRVS
ncbi:MAG: cbb3-type cytochrome c oxidase subunit I, partial [Chloroflexota bacterium]|nr:cbb3-type cytochrome c oxidase subunit I [Chloroflexota bacterium]